MSVSQSLRHSAPADQTVAVLSTFNHSFVIQLAYGNFCRSVTEHYVLRHSLLHTINTYVYTYIHTIMYKQIFTLVGSWLGCLFCACATLLLQAFKFWFNWVHLAYENACLCIYLHIYIWVTAIFSALLFWIFCNPFLFTKVMFAFIYLVCLRRLSNNTTNMHTTKGTWRKSKQIALKTDPFVIPVGNDSGNVGSKYFSLFLSLAWLRAVAPPQMHIF